MIKLEHVSKSMKQDDKVFHILQDLSVEIEANSVVVVQGISGSGKSTLLSILGGAMKPSNGLVEIDGKNIASYNDHFLSLYRNQKVGFITQSFDMFENLNVQENLMPVLVQQDMSYVEMQKRIDEVLVSVGMGDKKLQKVATLSGGERQRCVIARAMLHKPSLLLCDEPTAHLDLANIELFVTSLAKIKAQGVTVVIATHDSFFDTSPLVDRYLKLVKGRFA